MNEYHQDGYYDPHSARKKHSPRFWERLVESVEYGAISAFVCGSAYTLFVG